MSQYTKDSTFSSICIASYNGEKYIKKQLLSILEQIHEDDEVVLIDDASNDNTIKICRSLKDKRIRIYINDRNMGVNKSFERALAIAKGKYIFLADQDDIWTPDRYKQMLNCLKQKEVLCVSGNSIAIDKKGKRINYNLGKLYARDSCRYKKNIINIFLGKAYYYGCAMAFRREMMKYLLPFPDYIESHDLWLAMAANYMGGNYHLEKNVLMRRVHGGNASILKRDMIKKIVSRVIFLRMYFEIKKRCK